MNAISFSTQQRTMLNERAENKAPAVERHGFQPESGLPASADRSHNPTETPDLLSMPMRSLSTEQVQRISKAIADPQRFAILASIAAQDELPCKTLVANLSIKQATISHHLKELAAAQLIESRKQGQRAILTCRRDVCSAYIRELEYRFVLAEAQSSSEGSRPTTDT